LEGGVDLIGQEGLGVTLLGAREGVRGEVMNLIITKSKAGVGKI
jgi:hypothetical protein